MDFVSILALFLKHIETLLLGKLLLQCYGVYMVIFKCALIFLLFIGDIRIGNLMEEVEIEHEQRQTKA